MARALVTDIATMRRRSGDDDSFQVRPPVIMRRRSSIGLMTFDGTAELHNAFGIEVVATLNHVPTSRSDGIGPCVNGLAAEFLGSDITDGFRKVPTMSAQVLNGVVTLAVLPIDRTVEYMCTEILRTRVVDFDVVDADANEVGDATRLRWKVFVVRVANDHGAIGPNAQLRTM
jgi:hypothetical protein